MSLTHCANLLCIGLNPAVDMTISLDELRLGAVNRAITTHSEPAGKGLNVATVASQLKTRFAGIGAIWLTGFLGVDNQNEFLTKFDKFGIKNHCIGVSGATRQNIKLVEQNGTTTDVNGTGFVLTQDDKTKFFQRIDDDLAWADFVVLSGSLPQGFDLSDFENLLTMIVKSGKKWAVDTSGQALALAVKYRPFLIKPNQHELADLVGVLCDDLQSQLAILPKLDGIANVVVSMGEKGVHWFCDGKVLIANAPAVAVKSTVGAGDTLLAALVVGLLSHQPKADNLKQAAALAGFAVSQVGFELADNQTLADLLTKISIDEIIIET